MNHPGLKHTTFSESANHEELTVWLESGYPTTETTGLILPGPDGFDLLVQRAYSHINALYDARLYGYQNDLEDEETETNTSDNTIPADESVPEYKDWVLPYLHNQGDFAYSFGNGWRLSLPYIRDAAKNMIICLPTGKLVSFWSMHLTEYDKKDNKYSIRLETHDTTDFTFDIKMEYKEVELKYFSNKNQTYTIVTWNPKNYLLTLKDGTTYFLDEYGRTRKTTDHTGFISASVYYQQEQGEEPDPEGTEQVPSVLQMIDYIAFDYISSNDIQRVKFEYDESTTFPFIQGIYIEADSYNRQIEYTRDDYGNLIQVRYSGNTENQGVIPNQL